jgi:hypothetical protein
VNLSVRQLQDPDLVDKVEGALWRAALLISTQISKPQSLAA